jgi:hypothetical protein
MEDVMYLVRMFSSLALTALGASPLLAQTPGSAAAPSNYECAAGAHCNVSCVVDGDKVFQTGTPKTIAMIMLARNNYLVDLVEQSGETQHFYLAGSKIICNFEGLTRVSK